MAAKIELVREQSGRARTLHTLKRSVNCGDPTPNAAHFLKYRRRLHDKLIIVDERYVVDGSTNWSISALRDNYESATLIIAAALGRLGSTVEQ